MALLNRGLKWMVPELYLTELHLVVWILDTLYLIKLGFGIDLNRNLNCLRFVMA